MPDRCLGFGCGCPHVKASDGRRPDDENDHWFYGLFQSAPDLIILLLPDVVAASLGPDAPGDALYRFEVPELKAAP